MSGSLDVLVPDIGDFTDVPVAEILVAVGDEVSAEDPLVVLESDKASMEIPAPEAGTVAELKVSVGDTVSEGDALVVLAVGDREGVAVEAPAEPAPEATETPGVEEEVAVERGDVHAQVLVLGSGPGGYAAAFRAADLGLDVVMVERHDKLGGVCLNVGCIPSKALLHAAKVIAEAETFGAHGIAFNQPEVDLDDLRAWKDGVVSKLNGGVAQMAKGRKVNVVHGEARFTGPNLLAVERDGETTTVSFDHAIVAAGSRSVQLPGVPHDDPRVMDSTGALALADVPARLLVVGGGIIGLEMATVYDALGSEVTVVELAEGLIPGADRDLVKPLHKRIEQRYAAIHLSTKVDKIEAQDDGLHVTFSGDVADAVFDRVLVAVGRVPNGAGLGLDAAGVHVDERGFVSVDAQQRTNIPHIYAIGDVAGGPMLAHKATAEGHVAAEVIAGHDAAFEPRGIPSVAYTDPEVAWVGLTETEAKDSGVAYEKSVFPWSASGRALAIGGADGSTKLLRDPKTGRVLGAGIVGPHAGDLIAEAGLALEMGADVADVGLTIHAHPTLSETVMLAAEIADGTITDLPNKVAMRAAKAAGKS
ncbi:MAG TPA: dihydrolipoyl dehydrogenase [Baekduia sp.]|uniref:dihydrolipoyl dehydrogenase n=1 Tax=Baekduia sp. TaxID=2600305 RepID=UPI002D78FF8A|nr:dihydrolipoyl dehydrogenase [Baekduia sp.]HET6507328.1 dihydrolipoyl dehydrogenase [Baekduia sp.]